MIDTLMQHRKQATALSIPERYEVPPSRFALATPHTPSTVDDVGPRTSNNETLW